jgi:hypothetical protein
MVGTSAAFGSRVESGVKRYQRVMNTQPCYKETTYHHFHEVSAQPSRRGWFSAARPGDQYAE